MTPEIIERAVNPARIAVVGAGSNPGSLGARRLEAIRKFGFRGELYAVNPKGSQSGSVPGVSSLAAIGEVIDYALIAVPFEACTDVLAEADAAGVRVAQVLATPPSGLSSHEVKARLDGARGGVRLIGPNSVGIHCASSRITFLGDARAGGSAAFVAQSGGLTVDVLRQCIALGSGVEKAISIGNAVDLNATDFLRYVLADERVTAIGLYLEGVTAGHAFARTLAAAGCSKPVIVLRGGRTTAGSAAALSHTGAISTEDAVWNGILEEAGAISANDIDELISFLTVASSRGGRLRRTAMIGNGGGMSVLATDKLHEAGLVLATLDTHTTAALEKLAPPAGTTLGNPTDMPAGAFAAGGGGDLVTATHSIAHDRNVDLSLLHFNLGSFAGYAEATALIEGLLKVIGAAAEQGKPTYVALRGAVDRDFLTLAEPIQEFCERNGIVLSFDLMRLIEALGRLESWRSARSDDLGDGIEVDHAAGGSETVQDGLEPAWPDPALRRAIAASFGGTGEEVWWGPAGAHAVLEELGIPTAVQHLARSGSEAAAAAMRIGFPVALKIHSREVSHKSDVGGVRLGLMTPDDVEAAYAEIEVACHKSGIRFEGALVQDMITDGVVECLVAVRRDPIFGPVVLCGIGGQYVELYGDFAIRTAPVSSMEAVNLWSGLKMSKLLTGFRGRPAADVGALGALARRLSLFAHFAQHVSVVELNPVVVREAGMGAVAVDARIVFDKQH